MINEILAIIADAKTDAAKARRSVIAARAIAARLPGHRRLAVELDIEAACLLQSVERLANIVGSATVPTGP